MFTGPNIIRDGLVLHLDAANQKSFRSGATTWFDLSGRGNNGTLTNGPTFNSANGGSIVFDGTNDYVNLGIPSSLNIVGSITVESWVYMTSLTNNIDLNLIGKYSNAGGTSNQAWLLFKSTSNYQIYGPNNTGPNVNEFAWIATSNGSFNGAFIGTGEQVQLNTWYQVVGVFNSSNDSMQLYVNGNLKRSVTRTGQTFGVLATGIRNIEIGGITADNNRYLRGNIAISKVYNRPLTAAEVLQNYNATKSRFNL